MTAIQCSEPVLKTTAVRYSAALGPRQRTISSSMEGPSRFHKPLQRDARALLPGLQESVRTRRGQLQAPLEQEVSRQQEIT
jgi:hypothetical protein